MRQYPVIFDKCPMCGCAERLMEEFGEEVKTEKKVGQDLHFGTEIRVALVVDPRRAALSAPGLQIFKDICAACGFEYVSRVDKVTIPISTQSAKTTYPQGLPPFFPKG